MDANDRGRRSIFEAKKAQQTLVRLLVLSGIVVAGCVSLKIPWTPVIVLACFIFIKCRFRPDTTDLLLTWLVVSPFMGPFQWLEMPLLPDFKFQQGFILLALASLYGDAGIPRRRFLSNGIDYALLLFLGACLLSIAGSFMYRTPVRLFVDALLIPCAFYLIAKNCASKPDFLDKLYRAAVIGIIALGTSGLYETVTGRDVLGYGEEELDIFRVNGPMRMAEDYGLVMTMLLLFSFAMARLRSLRCVRPGYQRLSSLIGLLAVANTLTRGIWLGLGLGCLVQFARRKTLLFLAVIPLLAFLMWMAFAFVLPNLSRELWETRINNRRTIYARLATYQSALAMFYDHPLLGIGFGAFPEAWERFPDRYFKDYQGEDSVSTPHNFAFSLLAETGLVGGAAYSLLLIQIFRFSLRLATRAKTPLHRTYAEAMISITVAYLVAGLGLDFMRNIDFVNKIHFIFAGTLSGLVDLSVSRVRPVSVQEPRVLLREELVAVGRE